MILYIFKKELIMDKEKVLIEGLLFLAGEEGLTIEELASALSISIDDTLNVIDELTIDYQQSNRAFELVQFGGQYKLVTKEIIYEVAGQMFKSQKSTPLSNSALETLAIIAYKQPITRVEIEELRGVNCEVMLKKLVMKDLIAEMGRLDTVGKPILYQVTKNFMDVFKLSSLDELPELSDFSVENNQDLFDLSGD